MTDTSEKHIGELRKYVWDSHQLEYDTDFRHDLLSVLDDYLKVKAENGVLKANLENELKRASSTPFTPTSAGPGPCSIFTQAQRSGGQRHKI
jgi:hypothetical protein